MESRQAGISNHRSSRSLKARVSRESSFWRRQDNGLAIYLAENFFQYFRLALEFHERAVIAEQFDVKPLLPLFTAGGLLLAGHQPESGEAV
jgi:hypothetical protein